MLLWVAKNLPALCRGDSGGSAAACDFLWVAKSLPAWVGRMMTAMFRFVVGSKNTIHIVWGGDIEGNAHRVVAGSKKSTCMDWQSVFYSSQPHYCG